MAGKDKLFVPYSNLTLAFAVFLSLSWYVLLTYIAGCGWAVSSCLILSLLSWLLSLGIIVLIGTRILRAFRGNETSHAFARLGLGVACVAAFLAVWLSNHWIFAMGLRTSLEHRVNPAQLQEWAMSQVSRYSATNENVVIPRQELPSFVSNIWGSEAPTACVWGGVHGKHLVLIWGSGFGHWGMYVGSPGFSYPPSEMHDLLVWKPGIYVRFPTP
jgi:hypothetical protein